MNDLTIHDVPEDTLDAIGARAKRRGQSVEAAVLELMHSAASEERLLQQLDRVSRAVDTAASRSARNGEASRSRRGYRRVEPTARRP